MTIKEGGSIDEAIDQVTEVMRIRRRIKPDEEPNFVIMSSDAVQDFVTRITGPIALALVVISSIGLMVGGIGVMNIMLVSVTERTSEVGLRKALGATRGDVQLQFLIEAGSLRPCIKGYKRPHGAVPGLRDCRGGLLRGNRHLLRPPPREQGGEDGSGGRAQMGVARPGAAIT
jgi:hypothetical protein